METLEGVVVVGGGPVGLLTALKLGRAGVKVIVLESEACVSPSPRAVAYMPPTIAAMQRFGVLEDIRKRAVYCPSINYRHGDGTLFSTLEWSAVAEDTEFPYMLLLGQNHVSNVIKQHLQTLPNVDIRWNHRVESIDQDANYVTIETRCPGGISRLRARWVAATDGARSTVREKIGLSFDGITWAERLVATNVFYDFTVHGYSRANFVHDPLDWAVVVQLDQSGLWRVCYGEDPSISMEEVRRRMPERFKRLLPGAPTPDRYRVDHLNPYRVHQRCAAEFRRGRVILAGDAAHATNPMGGLGLSGGVLDAEHLARALISVVNDSAPVKVLDDYSVDRRKVFLEFTSPTATQNFNWMKESDPAQRARDTELLTHAGTDRAVMREVLLSFEKLNGSSRPAPPLKLAA
ncbi:MULTISPECIES: FAD-dependent monooxygenase [unclassified Caballeronia]|uniref:FAD-dependent monooxygenase n=1 Tax=unclassified Caballeronia TaxID=2646786 RepID=UPI00025BCB56|nr:MULTISPECIES: FAD-dependent monooxygenase [unclassified Caballeronia]AMW03660.1 para-nitrophenol 4-monooxygenase [pnpB-pnpA metabolic module vector]EKS70313.1 para-nitrophenol 4-monooxygenase [Burkholderia sp. SJ98]MCE4546416.1 FAD-dependent monooxygenase [Caballeronia sp. PC1]MCE4573110.1 FAD-dependent monooxygenase [Caballeronia sp. CLC5]